MRSQTSRIYIRRLLARLSQFLITNGCAVWNRSGSTQEITFQGGYQSISQGHTGNTHLVPDMDGEIFWLNRYLAKGSILSSTTATWQQHRVVRLPNKNNRDSGFFLRRFQHVVDGAAPS